jgi:hypothetical protein
MPKTKNKFAGDIIAGMESGPFQPWFPGGTWANWKTILKAAHGMPLTDDELAFFHEVAGDRDPPSRKVRELWLIVGRRGGKNAISSLIVAHAASQFDGRRRRFAGMTLPALRPGERASILCIANDRSQAEIALGYISSYFDQIPELAAMVTRRTRSGLELANGIDVIVQTNDFRAVRGRSVLVCILDECAFYQDENSASPDVELFNAVMPGMLTLKDQAMLIGISTPHKKSGLLWNKYNESYGKNDNDVLVIKAGTLQLNPTVDAATIAAEIAAEPELKNAEYLCEWRNDISSFIGSEVYDAAVVKGRVVLSPPEGAQCVGFVDVSGGVSDSHTCAVAFSDNGAAVLAAARELKTSDTDAVVAEFAALLQSYGVSQAYADRYGAEWVKTAFNRKGIELKKSKFVRSEIYANFAPMLNSGQVRLLDNKRLRTQMLALERRTIRGSGRDQIDHPRAGEDDLANSVAGALVMAARPPARGGCFVSVESPFDALGTRIYTPEEMRARVCRGDAETFFRQHPELRQ